ncbi:TcfC E-set like domain-containing protein [Salmonella enterica subsp. enterica serovar Newport]|nr:hypothetical protein [Salmonella enterica]EDL3530278.1 hypothetical protein [Salmonella enterica subsp. enterica serovar Newport]ECL5469472.1 hypothetical protein [Salmonella enterica]EIL1872293.1 TcfC E-set like domain-containing protein [Salmonella enterica]EIN2214778.1 TcfC E-set like domain-containing protein [Salmonella enterica subsp. enterica serovar Newport]
MMLKYSLLALSVSLLCGRAIAGDIDLAMITPGASPVNLTLANGDNLASSRYAGIITPEAGTVRVVFGGVTESTLNAKMSLDSVQFLDNSKLKSFLTDAGIREKHIDKILAQNSRGGFVHSRACKGSRSECIVVSKRVDFVVDYYNQTVRLFVAPELLRQSAGEKTYLKLNGGAGLINNLSAYYYETFGRYDPTYYIRNQGVAGAGVGFVRYNIYRSDYQNNVDELYYSRALMAGNKILAGRTQSNGNFNPSSAQSLFSDISVTGARIGTADELVDHSYGKKTFSYYSPSSGMLEVRKDNALVYAISTQPGFGELNLADLPYGQYNALIQVKSPSGAVISSQNVLVNNTSFFNNGFSWHIFGGKSGTYDNDFVEKDTRIIETGVQFPVTSLSALYLGGAEVDRNKVYSTGLRFSYEPLSVSLKMGAGSHGFRHYEANGYIEQFSLSWKKTRAGKTWNDENPVTDNTTLSAGYNFSVMSNLSASLGYMYSSSMTPYYVWDDTYRPGGTPGFRYKNNSWSSRSVYANVFYNFLGGSAIYINTNKELGRNDYSVSLGFSIAFGDSLRFNSTAIYSNGNKLTSNSTVDYTSRLSDKWSQTVSAGAYLADDGYTSATYNLSHNSNVLRGSGYYYATDNGQKQLTLSADSTQVINSGGIWFTPASWQDNAFIIRGKGADYDISVRNMTDNTTRYFDADTDIMSVPAYNKLMVNSDTSTSDLVFENHQSRESNSVALVPGASVIMSGKTIGTRSVIVTLRNSDNQYAGSASCSGDSCIFVSRLNQGVFRVKYTGNAFTLHSGTEQCRAADINNSKFISVTCQKR